MTIRRTVPVAATLVCTAILVLSGCSSSAGTSYGSPNVDVTTVPLQPGDLPATWKGSAHDTSDDASDAATSKQIAACTGSKDTTPDLIKHVYSKDYSSGEDSITSDAEEFKSSADVDSDVKQFASPKAKSCIGKVFAEQAATGLQAGDKLGTPTFTLIAGSNGGPSNVVATLITVVPVTAQGQTITIYDHNVSIRGDKIEASIDFTGFGKPIDQATITKAVAAVAKRAKG